MFDGIEVRRIGRQEQQVAAGGLDQAQRGWGLVEPGIVQDDHAGWRQHRQQNVLEIEVHDLARAVAVKDERRDQLLALAGGDDTGSVPSRTGHLLFNPCTPRCTGVFPIQAMIHAAFIQIKDGHVSQIFEFAAEQPALHFVALAIVGAFFLRSGRVDSGAPRWRDGSHRKRPAIP